VRTAGRRLVWALAVLCVCARAEEPAGRIVTLAPHLAEMVYAAGAGDRLVGSVAHTDYPAPAADLPRVGDAFGVDAERLLALSPDLVLAWEGGNSAAVIRQVRNLRLRVVALPATGLHDVPAQLERIGELAGTELAARAAASTYRRRIAALRSEHARAASLRVFYQVAADPLYTVGGTQPISDMIELCGGQNVFAGVARTAFVVSREAVISRDPELILGGAGRGDRTDPLAAWRQWTTLSAVAAGNLQTVDADLVARPGPRFADGADAVCRVMADARARLSDR
jgi:iron complex transport system substrate-binding protein